MGKVCVGEHTEGEAQLQEADTSMPTRYSPAWVEMHPDARNGKVATFGNRSLPRREINGDLLPNSLHKLH